MNRSINTHDKLFVDTQARINSEWLESKHSHMQQMFRSMKGAAIKKDLYNAVDSFDEAMRVASVRLAKERSAALQDLSRHAHNASEHHIQLAEYTEGAAAVVRYDMVTEGSHGRN